MVSRRVWMNVAACGLLIASGSNAQCNNATTTIHGYADIAPLTACKTFTGTIAVATDSEAVIELNGIQKIEGDFIAADNPHVTTLASDSLVEATGKVEFSNLDVLANITLPKWESAGTLILDRIPSPTYTDFQGKGQQIYEVYVRNTTFAFFSGLTLMGAQINVLEITDNAYLQVINFMAGNITRSCKITGNGGDLNLQLPNLTYAYSLEINNASEISLPMLSSVSNGLEVSYSEASELSMPELTYVGGDLVLANNRHLDSLELGELVNVQGNLEITGNDELADINGLPFLSSVGGDLSLDGVIQSIDLPALGIVRNNIAITSTSSLNCSDVPASLGKGSYSCIGNAASTDEDEDGSEASDTKSKGGVSAGAKAGIAIGVIAVVAIFAVFGFFFWRRRKQNAIHGKAEEAPWQSDDHGPSNDRKDNFEMEYYGCEPVYDSSSQKNLIHRGSELGRPHSSGRPGPEGRHEMHNTKDPPAAYELSADGGVSKEIRSG